MSRVSTTRTETDLLEEIQFLRDRIEELENIISEMRGAKNLVFFPVEWCLTDSESKILSLLVNCGNGGVSKEAMHCHIYSSKMDGGADMKIIDVFVHKARKKLKPFGWEIETVWGQGYRLSSDQCEQIRAGAVVRRKEEDAA